MQLLDKMPKIRGGARHACTPRRYPVSLVPESSEAFGCAEGIPVFLGPCALARKPFSALTGRRQTNFHQNLSASQPQPTSPTSMQGSRNQDAKKSRGNMCLQDVIRKICNYEAIRLAVNKKMQSHKKPCLLSWMRRVALRVFGYPETV